MCEDEEYHTMMLNRCVVGIQLLNSVINDPIMDDYDAGRDKGYRLMLDNCMNKFAGETYWAKAKKEFYANRRKLKGEV